ncbi:hypothetical protein HBI56_231770 [Parastagonospora nodorum]|uniref:Uncharacterized protein n=2 Tax=Phaeosphaeria nodorum (strain SN15 / ATCC MYA-4574 / FGSC 10173) TaxID=321614 RepID=A0A7U2FAN7_PHANO|nr:hypothetical protein SNOG_14408 [Parastagonospora nodorum SN15]KAH3904363.1 hypothetical protein HBH56_235060 [Parastagonospora nodorum]EAT78279.1 hypothetical protein SNOG_14408 [Parastagonospora nodorum SN15]KAH3924429.1 hypothetical protein HBH54_193320 [Parastagonospora nodorum]KAH3939188.1 hypothetical protein HBH53_239050 [Parastagonospora nodorum]KAH3957114.1 hypothetical protein HBH51_229280 [Parastagonospora nodorum]
MSSHGADRLDKGFPIKAKFPNGHIMAMDVGYVGQVYLHFAPDGTVIKAEADLIDAAFKHIIIDDPEILRIFSKNGDTIDMNILHPAAVFAIESLNIVNSEEEYFLDATWDNGRLINVTQSSRRIAYRINTTLDGPQEAEEGAVHKRIRESIETQLTEKAARGRPGRKRATEARPSDKIAVPALPAKRQRATKSVVELPTESTPTRDVSEEADETQQDYQPEKFTPRRRAPRQHTPRKRAPKLSKTPELNENDAPKLTKTQIAMQALYRVLDVLPDDHRETYRHFATVVRKEVAKDEERTLEFHRQLRQFVDQHGILEQHNEYVKLLKASGPNKAFQMPFFEDEGAS